jgi:MFS family permease
VSEEAATRPPPRLLRTFQSLAYREFRLLWLGQLCQTSASFSERVARGWLTLDLTGSAFQLGALELVRGVASLVLGMWGGVLADRFDKRALLIFTQCWTFAFYVVMVWLALSDQLELWHLYASAVGLALSSAVNSPVRTSMIPSLVPENLVVNAITLNSIATNASRMGMPALAAIFIQISGNGGWGYVVCAALYLVVLIVTRMIRTFEPPERARSSMLKSLAEGWAFAASHRPVFVQLIIGVGPLTIGFMYQAMLVAYARDTLAQGAAGYGTLYSCAGLGAFLGGIMLASRGADVQRGRVLMFTGFLNGTAMLSLGALGLLPESWPLFLPASILLMCAGGSQTTFRAANNGLMLANTPREMRGRVASFDEMFRNVGTIAAPALGWFADLTNPAMAMALIGGGCLLVVIAVWAWQPNLHKL